MLKALAVVALITVALVVTLGSLRVTLWGQASTTTTTTTTIVRIEEDSPAWNCATMGNHKCGPTVATR